MTYYAIANVNGPISVCLNAETEQQAIEEFSVADTQAWIDEPRMDAEDDLGIAGNGMTEDDFAHALQHAGLRMVRDMALVGNAHAGTVGHLEGGWVLWALDGEPTPQPRPLPEYSPGEFITPPENQGQIVTVSYALDDTAFAVIEKIHDAADNTTIYIAYEYPDVLYLFFQPWNNAPNLGKKIGECSIS